MITNKNYNTDLAILADTKKLDFAKGRYFDEKVLGNKSTRDKILMRLLKSLGILVSASGVLSPHRKKSSSKSKFLSSDPNELCDKLK